MPRRALAALSLALLTACNSGALPLSQSADGALDQEPTATPAGEVAKSGDNVLAGNPNTPSEPGDWGITGDPNQEPNDWGIVARPSYHKVVNKVVGMVNDSQLRREVQSRGLSLVNVAWEDTGRAQGSSLGPNITDLTLQVRYSKPGQRRETTALMPVIRFPNFSDRTGDVSADKFFLRMGNQHDKSKLHSVALKDVLRNIKRFASKPGSIKGSGNLLAKRDTHFLVSAQAVFLPIPKTGKAEFNPVAFNYQSAPGSPAVLSILVTRQGTSMSVVENRPESGTSAGWGQELYFNNEGQRAAFTAERLSTVKQRIQAQGGPKTADDKSALQKGADVLFLIQVPLKHKNRGHLGGLAGGMGMEMAEADGMAMPSAPAPQMAPRRAKSDVEQAVLGHGRNRGPFSEGGNLKLERDERFPVRITVQFYKATSNGVASPKDLDAIASSIGGVYEHADFVGSLVLPRGDALRPTAWNNMPAQWFPW